MSDNSSEEDTKFSENEDVQESSNLPLIEPIDEQKRKKRIPRNYKVTEKVKVSRAETAQKNRKRVAEERKKLQEYELLENKILRKEDLDVRLKGIEEKISKLTIIPPALPKLETIDEEAEYVSDGGSKYRRVNTRFQRKELHSPKGSRFY